MNIIIHVVFCCRYNKHTTLLSSPEKLNLNLFYLFLRIEEELGANAVYAGKKFRYPLA